MKDASGDFEAVLEVVGELGMFFTAIVSIVSLAGLIEETRPNLGP